MASSSSSDTCYAVGGNGVVLPDYGPCDPSKHPSVCCTPGQICLTNNLCATDLGTFYNGGCTDTTYKNSICPNFCQGAAHFIVECPSSSTGVKAGDFCCSNDGDESCCSDVGNALHLASSSSATRAVPASSAAAQSSSTSTRLVSDSSQAIPSSNSSASDLHTAGQIAGIATGSAAFGALLFIALSTWIYKTRKRRRLKKQIMSLKTMSSRSSKPDRAAYTNNEVTEADGEELQELERNEVLSELSSHPSSAHRLHLSLLSRKGTDDEPIRAGIPTHPIEMP